jgi:hypothetical protein
MIPNLDEICTCCGGYPDQPILQLFDDKCFRVVEGKETSGEFCLKDFAFPVDGKSCLGLTVAVDGGEITLFNNQLTMVSPNTILESGTEYVRGILLKIIYPKNDENGESVTTEIKNVKLIIENADPLVSAEYPLYEFFSIFTNPKSNKASDIINKIKIVNPNLNYKIRVSALILYGTAI